LKYVENELLNLKHYKERNVNIILLEVSNAEEISTYDGLNTIQNTPNNAINISVSLLTTSNVNTQYSRYEKQ
jgi:hypothetical protein